MADADVVRCQLLTIGSRTYRVQGSSASTLTHQPDRGEHVVGTRWQQDEEDDEAALAAECDADMIDESLIQQEGNQFVARLSCDAEVFPFLIGKEGRTRKAIESDTGSQLVIPRRPNPQQQQQQQQGGGAGGAQQGGGGEVLIRG
ncbi:hypothetical protein Agub_g13536, partial [Astrephomene gubernaculifera]